MSKTNAVNQFRGLNAKQVEVIYNLFDSVVDWLVKFYNVSHNDFECFFTCRSGDRENFIQLQTSRRSRVAQSVWLMSFHHDKIVVRRTLENFEEILIDLASPKSLDLLREKLIALLVELGVTLRTKELSDEAVLRLGRDSSLEGYEKRKSNRSRHAKLFRGLLQGRPQQGVSSSDDKKS